MKLIKVNEKTKSKFEECVAKDKPTLVLFYADWCPHCQMFAPTWKRITDALASKRNLQLAQIEFNDLKHVPSKYKKISGFPTIQVLRGGKVLYEYNGNRTEEDILRFSKTL